jgi:SAM-dependent methyltransferase
MGSPIYIDENINILTDDKAKEALDKNSDKKYFQESVGIIRVPLDRWKKSQICEKKHWMDLGIQSITDRNEEHYFNFNKYKSLKGLTINSACELGCGPFTNLRIIGNACQISKCTLIDPLIMDYLNHPNCSYDKEFLYTQNPGFPVYFRIAVNHLSKYFPKFKKSLQKGKKIAIKNLIDSPIETMKTDDIFDMVIIINVLEHCYDADLIFKKILSIMDKGAILVFQDKLYDNKVIKKSLNEFYDAAHPLQIDQSIILSFLEDNFVSIYCKKINVIKKYWWKEFNYKMIYFIGRKK